MDYSQLITIIGSVFALGYTLYLARFILKKQEGTPEMIEVAEAVRTGARAYLKRQYKGVGAFFSVVFVILLLLSILNYLPIFVPFAFLTGGFFSALSGYIGMTIATRSSARTAFAAKTSLNSALRIAFSAGLVMGLVVVGLALLDISIWYNLLTWFYKNRGYDIEERLRYITSTMICFGMGASAQALFARVGGGIYTKGADVGADLVGKVEAGIPEDDPRNPAVIADNVGDNVGDVAGMGADLYESYTDAIIATMALAYAAGLGLKGVSLPMLIATIGVISSIIGSFLVRAKEEASQANLLRALRRGIYFASILVVIFSYPAVLYLLGYKYKGLYISILSGIIAGVIIGFFTEFFTSDTYPPTKGIAKSALTGHATVIIEGISTGMFSTVAPVLTVVIATICAYVFGGGLYNPSLGLYGIGLAGVGLLSTLGITLATDAYGPVADNAGGNAEMTHQPSFVRQRTDALDALGNTTAATGKGFAIGSAALTALALIAAYKEQILLLGGRLDLSIMNFRVLCGVFIGAMYPFFFCSMALKAVGRAAQQIVQEVRRQFKEIVGLLEGKAKPDYAKAVDICTKSAQKEMLLPSILTVLLPIVVGILLGVDGVVGLLVGALTTGFAVAIMMANSGAAWDNAKKYIEKGNFGGKGTDVHKASITGDTVGDPFKDTAGPSLNILIKLISIVSIVFAGFIVKNSIFK
ncbi:MAG: sodium-translocating pyrophosphatase [Candidatus Omnitrophica bacterium]|nr:sodium-translocating pyrophosphatase [Candidatus Omnitrophota bacterium]MCM8801891.1 sodium-translocating pyrophosphatase [Candidatus Omnitrophota bacterium]